MGILRIFFLNTIEFFAQYGLFKVALVHFAFTSESWVLTLLVRLSFSHFDSIWVGFGLVCVGLCRFVRFGLVWAGLGSGIEAGRCSISGCPGLSRPRT